MAGSLLKPNAPHLLRQSLAALLAFSVAAAPVAGYAASSRARNADAVPGIKSIAMFSTANNAGASGEVAASTLDSSLKLRINTGGQYQATSFSQLLPSVQRGLNIDNTLSPGDIKPPITDPATAQKIARVMGTDGYLLAELDSYKEDPQSHAVSITVSGNLYVTDSGSAARTFAITGSAAPTTPSEGAQTVMQRAVNNAAAQIAVNLGASSPTGKSSIPGARSSATNAGPAVMIVLAAVLVGVIAHNAGTHGSQGGSTSSSSSSSSSSPPGQPF